MPCPSINAMLFHSSLMHPTVFIRKKILTSLERIYDESFNGVEDYELWIRLAEKTKFGRPSYFEVKLALSLMLFKRRNIDVAVIEVGLGGTLDASNILKTDVSVLVSVGLDHTETLGDTVEEIACDKVGIIKNNGIVVCGFTQDSTKRIALKRAVEKRARILFIFSLS